MRALLLDAMGTVVRLEPPAPLLAAALVIPEPVAEKAIAAEIAYYRAHLDEGRDAAAVNDLRRRCAEAMRDALPDPPQADLTETLLSCLHFSLYDDVRPALRAARARRERIVIVSNWDVSLHDVLRRFELDLDGVVTSAEVGARKPSPLIFEHALALAGVAAQDAIHVGNELGEDVAGARAAGIEPILLRREGGPGPPGVRTIETLHNLSR